MFLKHRFLEMLLRVSLACKMVLQLLGDSTKPPIGALPMDPTG